MKRSIKDSDCKQIKLFDFNKKKNLQQDQNHQNENSKSLIDDEIRKAEICEASNTHDLNG